MKGTCSHKLKGKHLSMGLFLSTPPPQATAKTVQKFSLRVQGILINAHPTCALHVFSHACICIHNTMYIASYIHTLSLTNYVSIPDIQQLSRVSPTKLLHRHHRFQRPSDSYLPRSKTPLPPSRHLDRHPRTYYRPT